MQGTLSRGWKHRHLYRSSAQSITTNNDSSSGSTNLFLPCKRRPLLLPLSMQQKPVEPNHFESQRQLPVPPIASSSHRTGPTFSSHMTELYTAQMAREEQMREDRRQIEATRLESKRKVQQTVFVYAWTEVCFVSTDLIGHLLITF